MIGIQDSNSVIHLISPTNSSVTFRLRLSADPEVVASGVAGVGVAEAEAALLNWIPVDSQIRSVRLRGSCKVNHSRSNRHNLFAVSACMPTGCSPDAIKGTVY